MSINKKKTVSYFHRCGVNNLISTTAVSISCLQFLIDTAAVSISCLRFLMDTSAVSISCLRFLIDTAAVSIATALLKCHLLIVYPGTWTFLRGNYFMKKYTEDIFWEASYWGEFYLGKHIG